MLQIDSKVLFKKTGSNAMKQLFCSSSKKSFSFFAIFCSNLVGLNSKKDSDLICSPFVRYKTTAKTNEQNKIKH